jgi:hypothetical protein
MKITEYGRIIKDSLDEHGGALFGPIQEVK